MGNLIRLNKMWTFVINTYIYKLSALCLCWSSASKQHSNTRPHNGEHRHFIREQLYRNLYSVELISWNDSKKDTFHFNVHISQFTTVFGNVIRKKTSYLLNIRESFISNYMFTHHPLYGKFQNDTFVHKIIPNIHIRLPTYSYQSEKTKAFLVMI